MQISSVDDWFTAIERGDWATVESNVEVFHGSRNMMHETGLMCAARKDFVDVVRVLMGMRQSSEIIMDILLLCLRAKTMQRILQGYS